MQLGLMYSNAALWAQPDAAVTLARTAEAAGVESLWAVEHAVVPAGYESTYPYSRSGRMPGGEEVDLPDPLVWLAYVAAATEHIRLATGVLVLAQREPVVTAKAVASLDVLARGRVLLGVGAGWLREEFDAIGVPFEGRGRRLDEAVGVLRALWSGEEADFHGEVFSFDRLVCRPRPVDGTVPIVVGGHSPAAARRAGRLGDGFFPAKGDLATLLGELRPAAEQAGRDPTNVEITAGMPRDPGRLEELAELGVSRVVTSPPSTEPDELTEALGTLREQLQARTA